MSGARSSSRRDATGLDVDKREGSFRGLRIDDTEQATPGRIPRATAAKNDRSKKNEMIKKTPFQSVVPSSNKDKNLDDAEKEWNVLGPNKFCFLAAGPIPQQGFASWALDAPRKAGDGHVDGARPVAVPLGL